MGPIRGRPTQSVISGAQAKRNDNQHVGLLLLKMCLSHRGVLPSERSKNEKMGDGSTHRLHSRKIIMVIVVIGGVFM